MKVSKIKRKIDRASVVMREEGIRALWKRLVRRAARYLGHDDPQHADWLRKKSSIDDAFDRDLGTQTGGIQDIADLRIVGENASHGLSHIASDPDEFVEVMQSLNVDFCKYCFVDLGSGKGRALILAAKFPFRRLVGVEFALELVDQARLNLATPSVAGRVGGRLELICGDATLYQFPDEPLVVYLFNPFGPAIIRQVAVNALESWKYMPRPMELVYVNPLYLSEFLKAGWHLYRQGAGFAHLRPPNLN